MNPEDEQAIKRTLHNQEMLFKAGLIGSSRFDESTMKMTYQWTADGVALRAAIFKTYDAIAKTEGENTLKEFCGLIVFILTTRDR